MGGGAGWSYPGSKLGRKVVVVRADMFPEPCLLLRAKTPSLPAPTPLGAPQPLSPPGLLGGTTPSHTALALPVSLVSSLCGQIPTCHRECPMVTFPCSQFGRLAACSTLPKYNNKSVNDAC